MARIKVCPEGWIVESVSRKKSERKILGGPYKNISETDPPRRVSER